MKKRDGKTDTSDAEAFERAMEDVVRFGPDPRGRVRDAPPVFAPRAATLSADHRGGADGSEEDFAASGVNRREIKKLKRGEYVVGDRLDLHGMAATDAWPRVRRFIENSRHSGHRCVSIVHGRGLHSEAKVSVLKARVREGLRLHQSVLAYSDAPRSLGGAGAVYVLLRK